MAKKNTAVFGIYRNQSEVNEGVSALIAAGYRSADISVLVPKTAESAVSGTLGWLSGVGALAIPGIGPFIAAGPIVAALAGAAAGGALGGFTGALMGMGIPEHEAERYEGRVRTGGLLTSVHCDNADWVGRAKKIMRDTGAEDIGSATEAAARSSSF
jgi:hypothetical protein